MSAEFNAAIKKRMREIEKIVEHAEKNNIIAANESAAEGAQRVKNILGKKGSYKLTKYKWGEHYSSSPGEPPAKGTGDLQNSIISGEVNKSNPAISFFGSNVYYSVYLEFGHGGPRPAAPRPFMRVVSRDPNFQKFITDKTAETWYESVRKAAARYKQVTVVTK